MQAAPLRNTNVLYTFVNFFKTSSAGGIILLFCAILALLWANSPWSQYYFDLWQHSFQIGVGESVLKKPIILWINDGLMAIFFFVIGLEIKREVLVGELSSMKSASFAIFAAIGGMLVPALFYYVFNSGLDSSQGWGIPMATDIAFVLAVLAMLGKRAPLALKIFVTALAIVDDLGAVIVIALFYTSSISATYLYMAGAVVLLLIAVNRMGVQQILPYLVLGLILWFAVLKSGVHATVAGVVLAMTIPSARKIEPDTFLEQAKDILDKLVNSNGEGKEHEDSDKLIYSLKKNTKRIQPMLGRIEHALHPWVSFFIMPVFALSNAGVRLTDVNLMEVAKHPLSIGVLFGLVLGKQIGVFFFSWVSVKLKLATLPPSINWAQVWGASCLTGIGFTMSIFIANLAFPSSIYLDYAKSSILVASLLSGIIGWLVLSRTASPNN